MTQPSTATDNPTPPRWRRYVALGDSFTEGLWDPDEANPDACRGWADRLAEALAARTPEPFHYANLAIRGKLLRPIIVNQVPAALRLEPDLVSLIGGGNDLLRPGADPDRLARNIEAAVIRIRETGADVLLGTGMDVLATPLIKLTRPRVAILNAHIWSIARRHGAHVLDLWGMRALQNWDMWSHDRIHLTAEGHRRIAQGALAALGQPVDDPNWDTPVEANTQDRLTQIKENALWLRDHAYPWATRRLKGRSSGDGRTAKRPDWT